MGIVLSFPFFVTDDIVVFPVDVVVRLCDDYFYVYACAPVFLRIVEKTSAPFFSRRLPPFNRRIIPLNFYPLARRVHCPFTLCGGIRRFLPLSPPIDFLLKSRELKPLFSLVPDVGSDGRFFLIRHGSFPKSYRASFSEFPFFGI